MGDRAANVRSLPDAGPFHFPSRHTLGAKNAMTNTEIGVHQLVEIAEAATAIQHLPAIATQDWCNLAAQTLLGVRRAAAVTVTIASLGDANQGVPFGVEATGGAAGHSNINTDALGRIHSDAGRGLGWSFSGGHNAEPLRSLRLGSSNAEIRTARLHDLPAWSGWPVTTPGKRWSRLNVSELLVLQTPLHDERPDRVLAVEIGAPRDQPVFGRMEAMMATALLPALRDRAALAFGARETIATNRVTRREQEILEQLTLGRTVRDIADTLNRSPHTVHDHVKSLHRKLNASSRGELISRYLGHLNGERAPEATTAHAPEVRVEKVAVSSETQTPATTG